MTGEGAVTVMLWPTTSSIGVTQRVVGSPSTAAAAREPGLPSNRALEVAVLVTASLVATVLRFALYRGWVFRGPAWSRP